MILIVDKKDSILRYQDRDVIRLEREGQKPRRIPLNQLEQLVVYGNPLAETAVWRSLAEACVPTVLLSVRGPQQAAMLSTGLAVQLPLRRLQHRCANQPEQALKLAAYVVENKLMSYDLPLRTLERNHQVRAQSRHYFQAQRDRALKRLMETDSIACLMGLEGQIAHSWFQLLSQALDPRWCFKGRNRRPPRDPVNALLSLGYTLLMSEVRQAVIASGFDPSLGFLHQDSAGRESLMLDVAEWFRAGVDHFVISWLQCEAVTPDSFYYRETEGCRLSKAARPLFYEAWAQQRYHWPRPFPGLMGEDDDWPEAYLPEILTGQMHRWRDVLKQLTLQPWSETDD